MYMYTYTYLHTYEHIHMSCWEKSVQTTDTFLQAYSAFGFTVESVTAIQRKNISGCKMQSRQNSCTLTHRNWLAFNTMKQIHSKQRFKS